MRPRCKRGRVLSEIPNNTLISSSFATRMFYFSIYNAVQD